jgi:hypothetical protein
MGETTMRLARVRPLKEIVENKELPMADSSLGMTESSR